MPLRPTIFQAAYVLAPQGAIADAALRVERGLVREIVTSRARVRRLATAGARVVDLGEGCIAPAFVDAHAHLELSGIGGRVPAGDAPLIAALGDISRFRDGDHPNYPGGWRAFPEQWSAIDTARACAVLARAIDQLPPPQRALVALRDVHHWSAAEVEATLEVSEAAQRIHLQRARSRLRALLDELVRAQEATA